MGNTITSSSQNFTERIVAIGEQQIWIGDTSTEKFFATYSEGENELISLTLLLTKNRCIFTSKGIHAHKSSFIYLHVWYETKSEFSGGQASSLEFRFTQINKTFYQEAFIEEEYLKIIRNLSPPAMYL